MLSSAIQYANSQEFGAKWGAEVSKWGRSILTLGSQVPSAYHAMGGVQREGLGKDL